MSNGNPIDSEFNPPYLVRVALYALEKIGVPIILAGVIIAIFAGWVPSPLLDLQKEVYQGQRLTHDTLRGNGVIIEKTADSIEELIYINRATCINQAASGQERDRCLRRHD